MSGFLFRCVLLLRSARERKEVEGRRVLEVRIGQRSMITTIREKGEKKPTLGQRDEEEQDGLWLVADLCGMHGSFGSFEEKELVAWCGSFLLLFLVSYTI